MRIYDRTKRILGIGGRFKPGVAAGRVPACRVRRITPADHDACIDIYRQIEGGHVPTGFRQDFEQSLRSESCYWLGVEANGELVGAGGIAPVDTADQGMVLVFGSIRPDRHGMGYGSALLLARIAALPPPDPKWLLVMTSLTKSIGFYKAYGFDYVMRSADDNGNEFDAYHAWVSLRTWAEACEALVKSAVSIDRGALAMPRPRQVWL